MFFGLSLVIAFLSWVQLKVEYIVLIFLSISGKKKFKIENINCFNINVMFVHFLKKEIKK